MNFYRTLETFHPSKEICGGIWARHLVEGGGAWGLRGRNGPMDGPMEIVLCVLKDIIPFRSRPQNEEKEIKQNEMGLCLETIPRKTVDSSNWRIVVCCSAALRESVQLVTTLGVTVLIP